MIYDKLEHIAGYLGCHPNLDTAIRYILEHDPKDYAPGRSELDGSNVFLQVMEANTSPAHRLQYEIHKNYMDIQIDISGTELLQIGDVCGMQELRYDADTDFGTVVCNRLSSCILGPGNFIVCMPGEPHMPGIAVSGPAALKKCVFKVFAPDAFDI